MAWSEPETWSARDESLSLIHTKTRARCRRVFEHLFRVQSAEVLELIIECWSREHSVRFLPIDVYEYSQLIMRRSLPLTLLLRSSWWTLLPLALRT